MARDIPPLTGTVFDPASTPASGSAWRREVFLCLTGSGVEERVVGLSWGPIPGDIITFYQERRVKAGNLQWVRIPPGDGSLQPEAIGAVVEVTKLLKYFDGTGHMR